MQMTIQEGIEHKLRVALIVAYLGLIGQSLAFLCQVQTDGVDTDTVVIQGIEVARRIHA